MEGTGLGVVSLVVPELVDAVLVDDCDVGEVPVHLVVVQTVAHCEPRREGETEGESSGR